MIGPTIQNDLVSIILRFRLHKVAFSADIEKMYRQIKVSEEDVNYQRIVWRSHSDLPIQHYHLTTVTYGTASAPYLATKTLNETARNHADQFPLAAKIVPTDIYVDDVMSGSSDLQMALNIKSELVELLKHGGFQLHKWTSNNPDFLKTIDPKHLGMSSVKIDDDSHCIKILGLQWNPLTDNFSFNVSVRDEFIPTKRKMLSETSTIFDPLGWLSPSVVGVKILFQKLWLLKLNWDDLLPDDMAAKWQAIRQGFPQLKNIRIPRWLHTPSDDIQLHGFSDASEVAFSAVVYLRSKNQRGEISINLVAAKTKVAPIKQISLPKLELCGALLLTRLLNIIKKALQVPNITTHAWTDSTIVLAWLASHPKKWTTYIANRTSEILETLPRSRWRHVKSKDNPADCASRGMSPDHLTTFDLWWHGPDWLLDTPGLWPNKETSHNTNVEIRQESAEIPTSVFQVTTKEEVTDEIFLKFSSYSKLTRVFAYCFRFITNCRTIKSKREIGILTTSELKIGTLKCLKKVQHERFGTEMKALSSHGTVHNKHTLSSLHPFLDDKGLLRVGGRLEHASCSFETKHPIILPKYHIVCKLLIADLHVKHLHAGISSLMGIIRQNYWIIGCRNMVKQHVNKCGVCFKQNMKYSQQIMGNLPHSRVSPSRPFLNVGVDYAGPIEIRTGKGRGFKSTKGYISVFVCFATKAVHLELVSELTTEAFVAALRRFIARRGVPAHIHSDNGTNFVGAKRKLNELFSLHNDTKISNFCSQNGTKWHMIPPASPNFGGLWEAGVKSVKYHLKRVIGVQTLTFEELATLLCQIEAILNSRPLCPLVEADTSSLDALTPGHFLIGEPLTALPEPDLEDVNPSRLARWQLIQKLQQGFWKRWNSEYLTTLQQRFKWKTQQPNLSIGDLVVVKYENVPPVRWPLARVKEVHPGEDGIIRVVTVQSKTGQY